MGRGAVLVLLALAGHFGRAGAQEPADTVPEAERPAEAGAEAADTVAPQRPPYEPPRWAISLTTGFQGFGELQAQDITVVRTQANGSETTSTLQRDMEAAGGLHVGVSALLGLTPAWALRGGLAWGGGRLTAGVSGGSEALQDDVAALPTAGRGEFRLLAAEAALRFRTVSTRRVQPYLELGTSVLRWDLDGEAIAGGQDLADGRTRLAALAALGAIVPVWPGISGRFQLSGHFFESPLRPAPPGPLAVGDSVAVTFPEPEEGPFADHRIELTRTLRLDVGISLELGRVRPAGSPESGSGAPSSGAPR